MEKKKKHGQYGGGHNKSDILHTRRKKMMMMRGRQRRGGGKNDKVLALHLKMCIHTRRIHIAHACTHARTYAATNAAPPGHPLPKKKRPNALTAPELRPLWRSFFILMK